MQRLEVSGAVRPLQWSLGVKGLRMESRLGDREKRKLYENYVMSVRPDQVSNNKNWKTYEVTKCSNNFERK